MEASDSRDAEYGSSVLQGSALFYGRECQAFQGIRSGGEPLGLLRRYFNQTRKPEGRLGGLMICGMNSGHARLADWGMGHLPGITPQEIMELGCGAGRNAGELLKRFPGARVTAIDYSPLSVKKTKEFDIPTGKPVGFQRSMMSYDTLILCGLAKSPLRSPSIRKF